MESKEKILFGLYYESVFSTFQELLHIAIYEAFEKSVDDYWKKLYDNAKDRIVNQKVTSEYFFKNISEDKSLDDSSPLNFPIIYNNSLNWSAEKKLTRFDMAEDMKHLIHIIDIQKKFCKFHNINDLNSFSSKMRKCLTYRNKKGHTVNEEEKILYSSKKFSDCVSDFNCVANTICKRKNVSNKLKISYKKFRKECDESQEKAGYEPINLKEFAEENSINENVIFECCKEYNLILSSGFVFEISKQKLLDTYIKHNKNAKASSTMKKIYSDTVNMAESFGKNYNELQEFIKNFPIDISSVTDNQAKKLSQVISTSETTEEAKEKVVEEVKSLQNLPELKYLNRYEKGFLTELEMQELFSNYNIFADTSAFMNKASKEFITNTLIPFRSKHVKKSYPIFIHRSARNELYEMANMKVDKDNIYDDLTLEIIEEMERDKIAAKNALTTINVLRKRNLIAIVGDPSYNSTAGDMLIDVIKDNCNKRFCVITQDKDYAEALSELNIKTLCAFKIAGKKPLIWSSIAGNFRCNHNAYINDVLDNTLGKKSELNEEAKTSVSNTKDNIAENSNVKAGETSSSNNKKSNTNQRNKPKAKFNKNITLLHKGDVAYTGKGKAVNLIREIGSGGEGKIYETNDIKTVAKIYHMENRSIDNYNKLKYMLGMKLSIKNVAWPIDILYDTSGNYVGFIMPAVPSYCKQLGSSVLSINKPEVRNQILPLWKKVDLVKTAYEIVNVFTLLNGKGILMGDVNTANILVNPSKSDEVYFVDCDSYQFGKYICPVGTKIFTSPNYYKKCNRNPKYSTQPRTKQDEEYAIASLIFQILMNGQAPFASKSTENRSIIDDICDYRFSFKTKENTGTDVPDGPYRMIWNNMEYNCKNKLSEVFEGKKIYSAKQWKNVLSEYIKKIQSGKANNEISPKKYLDTNGSFKDFTCDNCHNEANMHKDSYEKLTTQYKEPILICNTCKSYWYNTVDVDATCTHCGKIYKATYGEVWRNTYKNFNYVCNSCREKRRR